MAATVHIPLREIDLALDRARAGDSVMLDGEGEMFHLQRIDEVPAPLLDDGTFRTVRTDFRPLGVILADPEKKWSDVTMDDQWGSDMDRVLAENRAHDRDPWAE